MAATSNHPLRTIAHTSYPLTNPILPPPTLQFEPLNDLTIHQAAKDWCEGGKRREVVKRRYGPIEEWDVSQVTDMEGLFRFQREFNEDLSKWKVGNVTTMCCTFDGATSFNSDLSSWDVSKATTMVRTFHGAISFNQTLSGAWATSTADKRNMFDNCPGSILKVLVARTRAHTETHRRTHIRTHQQDT